MDGRQFDTIAKSAARTRTRRQALTTLLAGAGGGAFALLRTQPSQAAGCRRTQYLTCCQAPEAENCESRFTREDCRAIAKFNCGF
jgi:hypothetical protein